MTLRSPLARRLADSPIVCWGSGVCVVGCGAGRSVDGRLGVPGDYVAVRRTPNHLIVSPKGTGDLQATAPLRDDSQNLATGVGFEATGGTIHAGRWPCAQHPPVHGTAEPDHSARGHDERRG
jgi:hypothetical protein